MSDYTVVHPAGPFSVAASAAVTGGQLVEVTGDNTVGPAAADSVKVVGQALHDASAGADLTAYGDYALREATASGAVSAGDRLKAAASGAVAVSADATLVVGVALAGAADGATVRYQGR